MVSGDAVPTAPTSGVTPMDAMHLTTTIPPADSMAAPTAVSLPATSVALAVSTAPATVIAPSMATRVSWRADGGTRGVVGDGGGGVLKGGVYHGGDLGMVEDGRIAPRT